MKKILLTICLFLIGSLIACGQETTETTNLTTLEMSEYVDQMSNPYNVGLFVTEDLSTSIGINFEMPEETNGYVEFAEADSDSFTRMKANQKEVYFDEEAVYLYEIVIDGLDSNKEYKYKVVNEDNSEESEIYHFTTIDAAADSHSILYLADPQENAEIGYMAYAYSILSVLEYSNADFDLAMFPGDIINDSDIRSQWNLFFKYSSMFSTNIPMAIAFGNHEMHSLDDSRVNELEFDGYVALPNNGPKYNSFHATEDDIRNRDFDDGKTYSFDYGDAHIVVINTETYCDATTTCAYNDADNLAILHDWIRNDFNNSDAQWKIVMLHRGPYSLSYDTVSVRNNLVPVLEECGVDLVLAGHDHQYSRAVYYNGELIEFNRSNDYTLGTISLVESQSQVINFNNYSSSIGITYLTPNTTATKFYGGDKSSGVEVNYGFKGEYPVLPIITISENSISVVSYVVYKESAFSIVPEKVEILEEFILTK